MTPKITKRLVEMGENIARMKGIADLAAQQHGALSRTQALAAGLSSSGIARRVEDGSLRLVDDGVYVVRSARGTWLQAVTVACLATGGLASHLTAGRLWRLALPAQRRPRIDVVVDAARRPRSTRTIRVHRARAGVEAWRSVVQGVPTSELGPTLIQLGEVLGARALERAVDSAAVLRPGILFWLADTLVASRRGHGSSLMFRQLLGELLSDGTLDADVAGLLEGFPPPLRRHEVGGKGAALDFVWLPQKVALQTFDHQTHDRWKDLDALVADGFRVLVTHEREVKTRPRALISRLRAIL